MKKILFACSEVHPLIKTGGLADVAGSLPRALAEISQDIKIVLPNYQSLKKTEDVQLGMMVEIVKEYGNGIPGIIKEIKDKHVKNNEKEKNIGILITDHNVHETLTIVDRAYLLFEGSILKAGSAEELAND